MRRPGRPRLDAPPFDSTLLTRTCEQCGEDYDKPANCPWGRWLRSKFCGLDCVVDARRSA